MKALEFVVVAAVAALGGFVAVETFSTPVPAHATPVATDADEGTLTKRLARTAPIVERTPLGEALPTSGRVSPAELRRRVRQGADGTYIDDLLVARDSSLTRWPDRTARPLRVWVARAQLDGWSDDFVVSVQDAFDAWRDAGIPMHFSFVTDSAKADVRVRFRDRFESGISGKTVWSRDANWWLLNGEIELALAHPSGGTVDGAQMRAIALHEVGHLLGLDHAQSSDHIMAAKVRVRDLSDADRATVRLVYSMPAGTLRDGPKGK